MNFVCIHLCIEHSFVYSCVCIYRFLDSPMDFLLLFLVGTIHLFFAVSRKIKASGFDVVFGNICQRTRFFEEGIKKVKKKKSNNLMNTFVLLSNSYHMMALLKNFIYIQTS